MRALDFSVELRRAAFDVGVPDSEVFDMPMELGLELVTVVGSHLANAEREYFDDVVNKPDRVCLSVFLVNLERPDSRCIINCCVLETTDFFAIFSFEGQELYVDLYMVSWNLFLIALGVQFPHSRASGQTVEAVALEDAVDPSVRDFDIVVARQIPDDPDWPQVILATQIQHFLDDLGRRLVGRVFGS